LTVPRGNNYSVEGTAESRLRSGGEKEKAAPQVLYDERGKGGFRRNGLEIMPLENGMRGEKKKRKKKKKKKKRKKHNTKNTTKKTQQRHHTNNVGWDELCMILVSRA